MAGISDLLTSAQTIARNLGAIAQQLSTGLVSNPVVTTLTIGGAGGPTITAGTGAPTSVQPNSSEYHRTDGTTGSRLYISAGGGTWNAVSGV